MIVSTTMHQNKPRRYLLLILLMASLIAIAVPAQLREAFGGERRVQTPAPGSAERRAMLDAMRLKVRELHGLDVVFVVREMKVSEGWAWVHTLPQSKDGSARYEDFFALLRKENGRWRIAEIPCTEPDNPECIDNPGYFRMLAERFPGLPAAILPGSTAYR